MKATARRRERFERIAAQTSSTVTSGTWEEIAASRSLMLSGSRPPVARRLLQRSKRREAALERMKLRGYYRK